MISSVHFNIITFNIHDFFKPGQIFWLGLLFVLGIGVGGCTNIPERQVAINDNDIERSLIDYGLDQPGLVDTVFGVSRSYDVNSKRPMLLSYTLKKGTQYNADDWDRRQISEQLPDLEITYSYFETEQKLIHASSDERLPRWLEINRDNIEPKIWLSEFTAGLYKQITKIFAGQIPLRVDLIEYPAGLEIRERFIDPLDDGDLYLQFSVSGAMTRASYSRSEVLFSIAHEIHHAYEALIELDVYPPDVKITFPNRFIDETSASLFAACIQFDVFGFADISRSPLNEVNERKGGGHLYLDHIS